MFDNGNKRVPTYIHGDDILSYWDMFFNTHEFIDGEVLNVYIDFPYCMSNCKYCMIQPSNYNKNKEEVKKYCEVLLDEIRSRIHFIKDVRLGMIAFGGGTASLLPRETLKNIIEIFGDDWMRFECRKMEVHPRDLNDEYIDFLINDASINAISMGIQTFDTDSLKEQRRMSCNMNELQRHMQRFHDNNIMTNIDIVALFNGNTERDWELFINDIKIVSEIFKPSMFFTQVNYATQERYYEYTYRLRKELVKFINTNNDYIFAEDRYYKLDMTDIQKCLDSTYFMVKRPTLESMVSKRLYGIDPRFSNYMGFGGNKDHRVFSLTSDGDTIYGYYDFIRNRWIYELEKTKIHKAKAIDISIGNNEVELNDDKTYAYSQFPEDVKDIYVPTINVGCYVIPPYNPDISGNVEDL